MPDPRYSFSPLERRGILLGLQPGQLVTIGGAALAALVLHSMVGGVSGLTLSMAFLFVGAAGGLWSRGGQPLSSWGIVAISWLSRRGSKVRLSEGPTLGHGPMTIDGCEDRLERCARAAAGDLPRGIAVLRRDAAMLCDGYGVIRDRGAGSVAAVVPVRGRSLSLLDTDEQAQCLDAWRTVLAALARPGSPVTRLQWVQRNDTNDLDDDSLLPPLPVSAHPAAADSYRQLAESVGRQVRRHETWLLLAVGGERSPRAATRMEALDRELRFLEGQLRQAGLEPGSPLASGEVERLGASGGLAVREHWSALRVDGDWHATYWVAEWPRTEVGPDFLQPLLVAGTRTTVSVLMAPVPSDRALREVRSARTADLADAALRSRAGFLTSARREREAEGVNRRENELAEGHVEYRFSGYVTVSAGCEEELAVACATVEQAGHAAHLELRRLYGRQRESFTWTRLVGRGLR